MSTRKLRTQHPAGGPDWATIAAWDDAGRPPIAADGTWHSPLCATCRTPITGPAISTTRGSIHPDCPEETA